MNLSEHLTLQEFEHSETGKENNIQNNIPVELIENAKNTAKLFEVVRSILNRPCRINSGYRCKSLNLLVGGSKTSDHMQGQACDISCSKKEQELVLKFFTDNKDKLEWNQLGLYWKFGQMFLHISYNGRNNKKEFFYRVPTGYHKW